eukprot:SAG22_NODE_89_length_21278_cov_16.698758_10_plen_358_part_00
MDSLNLGSNRWAPLLPEEKTSLQQITEPLGVAAVLAESHDWDFGFSYEWQEAPPFEHHLTAEREVSYRRWSAGAEVQGVKIQLPFAMPHQGGFAAEVGLGRDGDFVLGSEGDGQLEWSPESQPDTNSGWGRAEGVYLGCYKDLCSHWDRSGCETLGGEDPARAEGELSIKPGGTGLPRYSWYAMGRDRALEDYRADCGSHCSEYRYFGLQRNGCVCGNSFGFWGEATDCSACGNGDNAANTCRNKNAVYSITAWELDTSVTIATTTAEAGSCWDTIPVLVPNAHTISDSDRAVSAQGAAYFSERFCPGWAKFVSADACSESEPGCDVAGNAVFDGASDMYDIGEDIARAFHSIESRD